MNPVLLIAALAGGAALVMATASGSGSQKIYDEIKASLKPIIPSEAQASNLAAFSIGFFETLTGTSVSKAVSDMRKQISAIASQSGDLIPKDEVNNIVSEAIKLIPITLVLKVTTVGSPRTYREVATSVFEDLPLDVLNKVGQSSVSDAVARVDSIAKSLYENFDLDDLTPSVDSEDLVDLFDDVDDKFGNEFTGLLVGPMGVGYRQIGSAADRRRRRRRRMIRRGERWLRNGGARRLRMIRRWVEKLAKNKEIRRTLNRFI